MAGERDDWIEARVNECQKLYSVPAKVSLEIKIQLSGPMQDRAFRQSELSILARTLLSALNDPPTEAPVQ